MNQEDMWNKSSEHLVLDKALVEDSTMEDAEHIALPYFSEGDVFLSGYYNARLAGEGWIAEEETATANAEKQDEGPIVGEKNSAFRDEESFQDPVAGPETCFVDLTKCVETHREPKVIKVVRKSYKSTVDADIMEKVWKAFFSMTLFIIPCLIGLALGVLLNCENPAWISNHHYKDVVYSVMLAFLGASVLVGLPFHLMAMDGLEGAVLETIDAKQSIKRKTTTTYYYGDDAIETEL